MPTRIPVKVAEHQFPSLNQARIHFIDILHNYEVGDRLSEADRAAVIGLMVSSQSKFPVSDDVQISTTRGYFGRQCFATINSDGQTRYLSIVQSLKNCVERDPKAWGMD